ncbi:MAG: hypothetical protein ACFFC7_23295 [Candidatus Hermodarchaeota archaeon]
MGWSPPRKTTVIISFLVMLIGLVIGVLGFLEVFSTILPLVWIFNTDTLAMLVGLIITFIGWLLLFLGVKMTNL